MSDKQKNWHAVEIEIEPGAEEAIEFALGELDSLGTEINQLSRRNCANPAVIGYFNSRINDTILRVKLDEGLRIHGFSNDAIKHIEWREIEDQDWLAEWKKHWRPTETARFIVAPVWSNVENSEKIVIRIEPSMAFGTGTHETTRLCLKAIEEKYRAGENFLDVGTGTGILAIAAAKLNVSGFRFRTSKDETRHSALSTQHLISACDTDAEAVAIAKENAGINECEHIEFSVGSISAETPPFDFVCANLTADVIIPLLPLLIEKSKRVLVLSGILKEQEKGVLEEVEKLGVESPRVETDGEWISVTIENEKRKTEN